MKRNNRVTKQVLASAIIVSLIALVVYAILSPLVVLASTSNTLGGNVVVPNTCIPIISNTVIKFGSVPAGSYASTANAENVIDFGNVGGNIIVNGGNWISTTPAKAFWVSNTLWSATSGANIGTQLGNTINGGSLAGGDTQVPLKANGGGNVIYFGVNVPAGQTNSVSGNGSETGYSQTVNVMLSC
jgi:hypothetical protein